MNGRRRAKTGTRRQGSFVFEASQQCNYKCLHCYNAWKNPIDYPRGLLPTAETLAMLGKMLDETGASLVTLSGGEPLLREDIYDVVDFLVGRGVAVNLLTNGGLLDGSSVRRLTPNRISVFELPLLSIDREIHDHMSGATGAWSCVTRAVAELKAAGQRVVCVFVATLLNIHTWRETAELGIALGVDGIMFNRFNPGGEGANNIEMLQASPEQLRAALDIAEELSRQYEISINCSIPMPPCLFDRSRWQRVGFGFCAAGTEKAYYTLDPLGNVRPCNHSTTILGNIRKTSFWDLADSTAMVAFAAARPKLCAGCKYEERCLGGCKAAAEACCGSSWECDPFLSTFAAKQGGRYLPDGW